MSLNTDKNNNEEIYFDETGELKKAKYVKKVMQGLKSTGEKLHKMAESTFKAGKTMKDFSIGVTDASNVISNMNIFQSSGDSTKVEMQPYTYQEYKQEIADEAFAKVTGIELEPYQKKMFEWNSKSDIKENMKKEGLRKRFFPPDWMGGLPILSNIIRGKAEFQKRCNVAPNKLIIGEAALLRLMKEVGMKQIMPNQRIKGMILQIDYDDIDNMEIEYIEQLAPSNDGELAYKKQSYRREIDHPVPVSKAFGKDDIKYFEEKAEMIDISQLY